MAFPPFWSYVYYIACARSEYYVHSPFVYTLMTECLNRKNRYLPENPTRLHARIQDYLQEKDPAWQIHRIDRLTDIDKTLSAQPTGSTFTAFFIDSPHATPRRERQWEAAIDNPDLSLTIDLFRAGLIFPHREMNKEHFCLRYF